MKIKSNVEIITKLLLFLVVVFCLVGSASAADYYVGTATTVVDGDTFCSGTCTASDTIIVRAGARGGLKFQDFNGSGSYITIKNENNASDEVVEIDGQSGYGCLSIYNCKYIDLMGNNEPAQEYGIKVINDMTSQTAGSVWVYGESDHINLSYLEITCEGSTVISGNGIFVSDSGLTPAWTFDTFDIHHNYIHHTRYAGMYLGMNDPPGNDNPYIARFSVHDNILEDLGTYGMVQKGHSGGPNSYYNNFVNTTGLVYNPTVEGHGAGADEWKTGIRVRTFTSSYSVDVYNNTVYNTMGPGILAGRGSHNIYNNTICNGGSNNTVDWGHGIVTYLETTGTHIYDNIIIQPNRYGVYNRASATVGVTLSRNLIGDAGQGEWSEQSAGDTVESSGDDANTYHADVASFGFDVWSDDGNYSNDSFTFTAGASSSYDNMIKSTNPDTVYNDVDYLGVGQIGSIQYRSWIWFNLSEYNSTDVIEYAPLNLTWYHNDTNRNKSTNVGIYLSNATTDTDYLNWNNSSNGVAWREPGGNWLDANWADNGTTPFASVLIPNTAPDIASHTFDITDLVQSIVNESRTNNGFFIIANETDTNYIAFSSLDNATEAHRPTLDITHSIADGAPTTSDFTYYKIITLNQSMINQSIGTGKYPLLVSDTDTDLRDHCQADGDDIVFFDADNTTQLPHEQELWNSTTGELVSWVGLKDVTNISYIVMYYNNSTIANSENATGVWDSNYMMVQHFQETDIDGGAGDIKDSTSNDNDGNTHNMTTANLDTGLINGCFNYSVSNEARVNVSDDSTLDGFTTGFTVSGIFNFNQEGEYYLVNKYDTASNQRAWLLKLQGDDNIRIYVDDAGTAAEISNFNPTIVPGTDYKIDAVWESGEYPILYVNGALANEVDHDGLVSSIKDSSSILRIGGGYSPGNTLFTGDEIRISNISRSMAYIETDTNNTLYPSLFVSFSAESESANAPNITSWENNKTSNDTLDFTINTSEAVNFNATANQTITTWNWYKDDVDQSHNYDNITLNWSSTGLKHVIVNATNTNGTSSSITWNVTVESLNYTPPNPISLSDTTGNFWVNFTWSAGSGNVTDSYNVSQNGTWVNGSSTAFNNSSVGAHGYSNIVVYAYNSSEAGTLSVSNITDNVTVPNNAISITNTSDWSDDEGQNVYVDYDATDADSDTPIFSCNRTDLFSDFNTASGIGNWQTDYTDAGIYYVDFGVSDGYGSTDNYTMTITVSDHGTPGIPGSLSDTTGNFYVNFTWSAGANTDTFNVSQNSTWVNGSATAYNNSNVGPHGWSDISVYGYNSTSGLLSSGVSDNVQVPNNAISISNISASYSINECETLYIDADYTDADSDMGTFNDNSSEWNVNSGTGIVSWVPLDGEDGVYNWYINVNDGYGSTDQFNFTVTVNDTVTTAPTINDYTNSISSTNMYPVVTNSGSVTFYASANQPVTTWTWYIDDVDQSNNADSFTTSWSKLGYKSVEVIAENAAGVSNMVEWNPYIKMAMAGAGDTVSDMNESGYDNLIEGIGGDSPDFELVLWAFTEPYQVVVGNMFFAILFGIPMVMFWIRQGSLIIPSMFGIVLGTMMFSFMPSSFALTASAIIVMSVLSVFYSFYKERR